ncbi:MAG: D-alanyl-D-alanine carboxypeptidase, partial [Proteobacteria bacterium]|nr:D-alanyl-D-alanine carboxypeptidase [Pseudomonadota bacterium]
MSVFKPREYYPRGRLGSLAPAALFLYLVAAPAAALETIAKQAILMDAQTGTVLFEKNADDTMPPSSMSKLMTVYMVFERLKSGSLTLDDKLPVSKKAWRKGGSKMYVLVG